MPTVLMTGKSINPAAHAFLEEQGMEVLFLTENSAEEIERIVTSRPVDAIIARTHAVPRRLIEQADSLRIISRHGVGYDNVDVAAATEKGVPVTIAPGTNAQAVAEMTVALMFAVARRLVPTAQDVKQNGWDRSVSGVELSGKTFGAVGFGRIGQLAAGMCRGLGMDVVVYDPFGPAVPGVAYVESIEALVARADVVSLHCPAQADGSALITSSLLAAFRKRAILINTSRGSLVDEQALFEAIQAGALYGAGLDTLTSEPPEKTNPLLGLDAVVISPHMGGSTAQALEKTALRAAMNVVDFLKHGKVDSAFLINKHYAGEQS